MRKYAIILPSALDYHATLQYIYIMRQETKGEIMTQAEPIFSENVHNWDNKYKDSEWGLALRPEVRLALDRAQAEEGAFGGRNCGALARALADTFPEDLFFVR